MTKRYGLHSGKLNLSELEVLNKTRLPVDTLNADFDTRYTLEESFQRLPSINASIGVATNLDFEVLGTNASADDVTYGTTLGAIQLQTDGADNDQVIILPHLDASQSGWAGILWGTENQTIWEAVIKTDASVADIMIWAGLKLTDTSTVATDADAAYFRFDAGVANWEAVTSIAGTDVETDTGIVVAAATTYHLKIEINSQRKAKFFINDKLVYMSTALTDNIDLIPYIGVQANGAAAAKTIHLVKEKISRIIFE